MKHLMTGLGLLAASVATLSSPVMADYPTKPITYVVAYAPGGTSDNVARIVSEYLSTELGQPVVIENKPGAGGTLGAAYVAASAPDGYTLFNAAIGNLAIAPQLIPVRFDPFADFTPIAHLAASRSVIAVNPALPIHSIAELIAYSRANPGKLSYGTSGHGTPGNISVEYFKLLSGADITHVPYRGSALALTDTIAGHIDLMSDPLANGAVKSGHLRGLAYFGSDDGSDLPGVPSLLETYPEWNFSGAFLALAPSGTPPEVVQRLRAAFDKVLSSPEVIERLKSLGVSPQRLTPEQTSAVIRATHDISAEIISKTNLKVQ